MRQPDSQYLFNCSDLYAIYQQLIVPYLGVHRHIITAELVLLSEVYDAVESAEDVADFDFENSDVVTKLIGDIFIPTDVREQFLRQYAKALTSLLNHIDYTLRGKLLINFNISACFTLTAYCMNVNYEHTRI